MICQSAGHEVLGDINQYLSLTPIPSKSAIDIFYEESRAVLLSTPAVFDANGWIGALNLISIVSLTENYFRTILGQMLKLCPICKKNAADNNINFGSVLWHPEHTVERGAFEHVSFSESKKILEIARKYVGVDLSGSDLIPILKEFSKVCELRHGVVHSAKYLAGKNALLLDVQSSDSLVSISVGYAQLQNAASVCTTLVVSFNHLMFETLCKRWAVDWRVGGLLTPITENELLKQIWFMFFSRIDHDENNIDEPGTWIRCRNLIKAEFNL